MVPAATNARHAAPTADEVQRVADALVREFRPRRVVLFGSRAAGTAQAGSDVDLLVVLPFEGSSVAMMSALLAAAYRAMERPFALDVHPRRPARVAAGATPESVPDPLMRGALDSGITLYEAVA